MALLMGAKVGSAARAIGILIAIWGVVLAIAYVADSLPGSTESTEAEPDPEATETTEAEATETAESTETAEPESIETEPATAPTAPTEAATETPVDTESETAPTESEASGRTIGPRRHTKVCEGVEHARLGVGSVVGDPRPEQIVLCGREAHVFAVHGGELARLATLTLEGDTQVKMAAPVVTDVDGDGLRDLVLGWTELDAEGGPNGGTLRWVAGDPSGGFGEDHVLHPLSVVDIQTAELDGRTGADLVALHWADGFGRRPSEAWVFAGGPSPRRLARRRLRHDAVAAALADVDGDGELDLITVDAEGAQIADGDGSGRFPRVRSIVLEAGRDVVAIPAPPSPAPAEGEAAPATVPDTVYLVGAQVMKLDAAGEPTTIPAPHGILRALGLPTGELLAMTRQRVARVAEGSEETVVDLPGTFRPTDMALVGGDESPVLLVLGRTSGGWELVEAPIGESRVRLEPAAEPSDVVDAPLVLNLTLR